LDVARGLKLTKTWGPASLLPKTADFQLSMMAALDASTYPTPTPPSSPFSVSPAARRCRQTSTVTPRRGRIFAGVGAFADAGGAVSRERRGARREGF
jgi:hypothetical protein